MSFSTALRINNIDAAYIKASRTDMLSPHFSLWELCQNHRHGLVEQLNFIHGDYYRPHLVKLCQEHLEPLRNAFGRPIHVNSGLRWAHLEGPSTTSSTWQGLDLEIRSIYAKRGYKPTSQHIRGMAADVVMAGTSVREMWEWARFHSPYPFGQIICEMGARSNWLHISIPGERLSNGKLIYGEVMDATVDAMGRARYQRIDTLQGPTKDRWGKYQLEQAIMGSTSWLNGARIG